MDRSALKKLFWLTTLIDKYASEKHLDKQNAAKTLRENGGLKFASDFYDVEHLLSFEDVVANIDEMQRRAL